MVKKLVVLLVTIALFLTGCRSFPGKPVTTETDLPLLDKNVARVFATASFALG